MFLSFLKRHFREVRLEIIFKKLTVGFINENYFLNDETNFMEHIFFN